MLRRSLGNTIDDVATLHVDSGRASHVSEERRYEVTLTLAGEMKWGLFKPVANVDIWEKDKSLKKNGNIQAQSLGEEKTKISRQRGSPTAVRLSMETNLHGLVQPSCDRSTSRGISQYRGNRQPSTETRGMILAENPDHRHHGCGRDKPRDVVLQPSRRPKLGSVQKVLTPLSSIAGSIQEPKPEEHLIGGRAAWGWSGGRHGSAAMTSLVPSLGRGPNLDA